jgi:hypothetical protein
MDTRDLKSLWKRPISYLAVFQKNLCGMQDQEKIITAYGDENRAAAQQIKALEARMREKDEEMRGERQRFESELVRNMEAQRARSTGTATKLQCGTPPAMNVHPPRVLYVAHRMSELLHVLLFAFVARGAIQSALILPLVVCALQT